MLVRYFEHPWWLIAGIAAMLLIVALASRSRRLRRSRCDTLGIAPASQSWLGGLAFLLAIAFLATAAAGPRLSATMQTATAAGYDLAIVLDVSRSMSAKDAMPDRLARAEELAREIVANLARQGGHRVSLIAFSSTPTLIAPLTYDLRFVQSAINDIDATSLRVAPGRQVSGTRIGAGINLALESLSHSREGAGLIVLLSDGDDPVHDGEWGIGADAAASAHVPIGTIGIGDPERDAGVPGRPNVRTRLHEEPMRELATRTGGKYLAAKTSPADVIGFVRALLAEHPQGEDSELAIARSSGRPAPFLAAGVIMLTLALVGIRWRAIAAGAAVAAMAAGPVDDWLRRGDAALSTGQPEKALQWYVKTEGRAPDPGLVAFNEGVALAALGRYREAELHFRWCLSDATGPRRSQALYNMGTSLIRRCAGRKREPLGAAIQAFEEADRITPAGDQLSSQIRANLGIAKELLAQVPADQPNTPESESGDASEPTKSTRPGPQTKSSTKGQPKATGEQPQSGDSPQVTDQPGPAGKGSLPALADTDTPAQITSADLDEHLRRTMARIAAARQDRVKAKENERPPSYPDW
ncbi:MAG: VWA domain-containing protein [Gemmataceae bacterium]